MGSHLTRPWGVSRYPLGHASAKKVRTFLVTVAAEFASNSRLNVALNRKSLMSYHPIGRGLDRKVICGCT